MTFALTDRALTLARYGKEYPALPRLSQWIIAFQSRDIHMAFQHRRALQKIGKTKNLLILHMYNSRK